MDLYFLLELEAPVGIEYIDEENEAEYKMLLKSLTDVDSTLEHFEETHGKYHQKVEDIGTGLGSRLLEDIDRRSASITLRSRRELMGNWLWILLHFS